MILHALEDLQFKDWQATLSKRLSILAPVCMVPKLGFFQRLLEGLTTSVLHDKIREKRVIHKEESEIPGSTKMHQTHLGNAVWPGASDYKNVA